MIETMTNERSDVSTWVENQIELPPCCPVSNNPQPGSRLSVRYRVMGCTLEVASLKRYVRQFVGGHLHGIRNMETMIQTIAADCAQAVQSSVTVRAELVILPCQTMVVLCKARPDDILPGDASELLAGESDGAAVRIAPPAVPSPATAAGQL